MIEFFTQHMTDIMAIVTAIIACVSTILSLKTTAASRKYLESAKQRETYSVCPKCGAKVPLSQMSFHLPTGELDNDLDGVPDFK